MSDTTDQNLTLVQSYVRKLDTSDLIDLWETLTEEINNPSVLWTMEYFLDEYLPECISAKTMDILDLARIVTGNDGCVKRFDINDEYVYVNSFGLWESVNECDITDLVINFINDYSLVEYSDIIKSKLAEIKEDSCKE